MHVLLAAGEDETGLSAGEAEPVAQVRPAQGVESSTQTPGVLHRRAADTRISSRTASEGFGGIADAAGDDAGRAQALPGGAPLDESPQAEEE